MRRMTLRFFLGVTTVLAASVFTVGCVATPDVPLNQRLQGLDRDLTVGASGDDVGAVHDYLTESGFFPNDALARDFPAWRPVISRPPADHDVFDATTAQAVRGLQATAGLPATGIVDQATRAIMRMIHCGNPVGLPRHDPSEKFALLPGENFARGSSGDAQLTWGFA